MCLCVLGSSHMCELQKRRWAPQSWNHRRSWATCGCWQPNWGPLKDQCSYPQRASPAPWTLNFYQMSIHPHSVNFLFNLVLLCFIESPQFDIIPFVYSCLLPLFIEMLGIEPRASHTLGTRKYHWATSYLIFVFFSFFFLRISWLSCMPSAFNMSLRMCFSQYLNSHPWSQTLYFQFPHWDTQFSYS